MRTAPFVGCALVLTASPSASRAAEPAPECPIQLAPDDASDAWKAAVRSVEARGCVLAKEDGDCRAIVVRVVADGAVVELTTTEGKLAVRHVGAPSELAATVDALLVTVLEPALPPSVSPNPKPSTTTETPPRTVVIEAPAARTSLLLGLEAGARMGWPGRFVSPVLGGFAGVSLVRWEIGIFGRWETSYSSGIQPLPPGVQLSAVVAGVTFGRRIPLSSGVALLAQAHLGGAIVSEEGSETNELHGDTEGESRAGLSVGLSLPHDAAVRFRPMFGFDVVPTRSYSRGKKVDPTLPEPPTWALTFMLALESEALL